VRKGKKNGLIREGDEQKLDQTGEGGKMNLLVTWGRQRRPKLQQRSRREKKDAFK